MARSKVVTLGGQEYEISQLSMRANSAWRKRLEGPFGELAGLLASNLELSTGSDLVIMAQMIKSVVIGSMDLFIDLLFDYAPSLAEDRERILDEAYDDEAITALGVVVSLAYPLDRLALAIRGRSGTATSTNSPPTNGATGRQKRSARSTNP